MRLTLAAAILAPLCALAGCAHVGAAGDAGAGSGASSRDAFEKLAGALDSFNAALVAHRGPEERGLVRDAAGSVATLLRADRALHVKVQCRPRGPRDSDAAEREALEVRDLFLDQGVDLEQLRVGEVSGPGARVEAVSE